MELVQRSELSEPTNEVGGPNNESPQCVLPIFRHRYAVETTQSSVITIELSDDSSTIRAAASATDQLPAFQLLTPEVAAGGLIEADVSPEPATNVVSAVLVSPEGERTLLPNAKRDGSRVSVAVPNDAEAGAHSLEIVIPDWTAPEVTTCDGVTKCDLVLRQSVGDYGVRTRATQPIVIR